MKHALKSALLAGALAISSLAVADAQPASATTAWLLQNVATGKCLQTTTTSTTTTHPKMAACSKSSAYQKWFFSSGHVRLAAGGSDPKDAVCLAVEKSPGDFAREVVATSCGNTGAWAINFRTGITSNYPVASITPSCYLGHYSSGDTYPNCYVNDGSYTRWNWVAAN